MDRFADDVSGCLFSRREGSTSRRRREICYTPRSSDLLRSLGGRRGKGQVDELIREIVDGGAGVMIRVGLDKDSLPFPSLDS